MNKTIAIKRANKLFRSCFTIEGISFNINAVIIFLNIINSTAKMVLSVAFITYNPLISIIIISFPLLATRLTSPYLTIICCLFLITTNLIRISFLEKYHYCFSCLLSLLLNNSFVSVAIIFPPFSSQVMVFIFLVDGKAILRFKHHIAIFAFTNVGYILEHIFPYVIWM